MNLTAYECEIDVIEKSHQVDIFEYAEKFNILIIDNEDESMAGNTGDVLGENESGENVSGEFEDIKSKKIPGSCLLLNNGEPRVNDPVFRLAAAVILQAVYDVQSGNPDAKREAMYWLQSEPAEMFFDLLGLGFEGVERWLNNGMPMSERRAKRIYKDL